MSAVISAAPSRSRVVREVLVTVVAFLLAGALAGLLWFWWWSPAPETSVYLIDGGRPLFEPDLQFRSTGLYLAVAVPLGLVLGAAFMWINDRDELLTLGLVTIAAVLAGLVMVGVGTIFSPGDPTPIDVTVHHPGGFPTTEAALEASPVAWVLGFPGGALIGCVLVLVGFPGDGATPRRVDHAAVDVPAASAGPSDLR